MASAANGDLVVVGESYGNGQDGSGKGVLGQRFAASGVPQRGEFQVNSFTTHYQWPPAVATDANRNFLVVWMSTDASDSGVSGQHFNASGLHQGSEFQVNSHTPSYERWPAVATDLNGNFVVVWESYGQDGSGPGIFGQRYGDLIFKNGFQ